MRIDDSDFAIEGADGAEQRADNGRVSLTVHPDGVSRLRKRIAIKRAGTPQARRVVWLYGEIDCVRAYVGEDDDGRISVVLTRRDLYP